MTSVVLASVCVCVASSAWAQGPVQMDVTQCRVTLTDTPPDASGGWGVQFLRGGTTSVGNKDTTPPYTRSTTLGVGSYVFSARWTKSGYPTQVKPLGSADCPPVIAPPPPPPPQNCVLSEWALFDAGPWEPVECPATLTQTRAETWTRQIVTHPTNGGAPCGLLTEVRTGTQSCAVPPPPPPPVSTKFQIGDRIIADMDTLVRTQPSTNDAIGVRLGSALAGALGTIIDGPIAADGLIWWHIDYDVNPDGWSGGEDRYSKYIPPGQRTVRIEWDAVPSNPCTFPVTCVLEGYRVYVGAASGVYTEMFEVGASATYTYTTTTPGPRFFVVTTVADTGESVKSNEVVWMVP